MIMSLVAMTGGVVLYLLLRKQLKRGRFEYPPLIGYFNGKRGFERCLVVMMRGVRRIESESAPSACKPSCSCWCCWR